jgi:hypothetical protein
MLIGWFVRFIGLLSGRGEGIEGVVVGLVKVEMRVVTMF